jgi:hypothetical protein
MSKILLTLIANVCLNEPSKNMTYECAVFYNNCVISETMKKIDEDKAFKMCQVKWNNEKI